MTEPGPAPADEHEVPAALEAAMKSVFGAATPLAQTYAGLLRGRAIERGLLGPREGPRIWERHLFNCAAITDVIPSGERVVDVGSGAGLPGLVLAIRRPDVAVDLVEPSQRRCTFLREAVAELGLGDRVRVVRGRADEPDVLRTVGECGIVSARAVAPLERLMTWTLPLLRTGGTLLAMKGARAGAEARTAAAAAMRLGGEIDGVLDVATALGSPARVVVVRRTGSKKER